MEKNKRIQAERLRLAALFQEAPREVFYTVLGLIDQAAFLRIALEDIQAEFSFTDTYKNGEHQSGRKISAALQAYNQTIKVYQKLIVQLEKYVPYKQHAKYRPPSATENEVIAFENFRRQQDIEFYLSDDFKQALENDRAKALDLMLAGN